MSELKPCPFCGRNPTAIETYPGRGELYCGSCDVVMGGEEPKTQEELIKSWNARADERGECCMYENLSRPGWLCSECGKRNDDRNPNYCPNCGRKVRP